jgi:hypothetical protein
VSIPPNQAPQQPYGAPQQGYGVPPQGQPYGYPAPQPTGSNGFAVTSLIFGILPAPLFGIGFGIAGLVRAGKVGKGKAMSWVGIILSLLWTAVIIAVIAAGVAFVGSKVAKAMDPGCVSATTTVTTYSDKINADASDPAALKVDLKSATDELNQAAAKAGNADAKAAITALAGDYQSLYTSVNTGTAPSAGLTAKMDDDGKKLDTACGHVGS